MNYLTTIKQYLESEYDIDPLTIDVGSKLYSELGIPKSQIDTIMLDLSGMSGRTPWGYWDEIVTVQHIIHRFMYTRKAYLRNEKIRLKMLKQIENQNNPSRMSKTIKHLEKAVDIFGEGCVIAAQVGMIAVLDILKSRR